MHDDGPPAVVESGSGNYSGRRNTPAVVHRVRTRRPCARLSQIGTASQPRSIRVRVGSSRNRRNRTLDWHVEDIAAYYVQAIRIQQPDGPYRVVGHSFGGIVAFEVAQQLVASGGQVSFVGLLDTLERQYMQEVRRSLRIRDRVALIGSEFRFALHDRDPFGPVRRRLSRYTKRESSSVSRDPYRQRHNPKPRSRTRI